MSALEDIRARADGLAQVNTYDLAVMLSEYGEEYKLLAQVEADHRRLLAALDAIQSIPPLVRKTNSSDDPEHVTYSEGWDTMANGYNSALREVRDVIKGALRDR